jgi:flagellar biosynthesis protein
MSGRTKSNPKSKPKTGQRVAAPKRPPSQKRKEPLQTATALLYEPGQTEAPRVVATGRGRLAERIIALAEAHDIPLVNDPALALTLSRLELNTEIPPELYLAVAQILAFVYRLDSQAKEA